MSTTSTLVYKLKKQVKEFFLLNFPHIDPRAILMLLYNISQQLSKFLQNKPKSPKKAEETV